MKFKIDRGVRGRRKKVDMSVYKRIKKGIVRNKTKSQ